MAGKHEAQREKTGGRGRWVLLGLLALLAAGYVVLCAAVGDKTPLPRVYLGGTHVAGMPENVLVQLAQAKWKGHASGTAVTLKYGDWEAGLNVTDLVPDEEYAQRAAQAALAVGREHFLLRGFHYLRHQLGTETHIPLTVDYAAVEQPALAGLLAHAQDELGSDSIQAAWRMEGEELVMTKGVTDIAIDVEATAAAVYDKLNHVIFPALGQEQQPQDTAVELVVGETAPQTPDFDAIHTELYAQVAEPVYDKTTNTVSDHKVGIDFDVKALQAGYERAGEGETFSIPLTVTQPRDTKDTFTQKLFADTLGTARSAVSGSSNRKTNVKLSAAACDGVILLPGEVFAYNETTGSRSADKGYLPAPTYSAGASVDDVGGGICQTSSTIYYAVLHTTLEIVERHNHSYATGYVPDGMDATVFYGVMDFRFRNSTNYPLKIVTESYDSGGKRYLRVTLLGTNEDGRYATPTNNVFEVVQPTTTYLADNTVPQGTLVLDKDQNAYRGRKAQVTRTIYEADGTQVEQQDLGVSRYKMRPHLYRYNPLDGDPATWPDGQPPKPQPVAPVTPVQPEPEIPVVPADPAVTPETTPEAAPQA